MTVSLTKVAVDGFVRIPGDGDTYDVFAWDDRHAPLWWDDASYARYQADDPMGYDVFELNLDRSGPPIVRRWVCFELGDAPMPSRRIRSLLGRFDSILRDLRLTGIQDRVLLDAGIPF